MKSEEKTNITDAADDAASGKKKSMPPWMIGGTAILIIAVGIAVITATLNPTDGVHQPTAEDIAQLQYDAGQKERDQRRVDQLQDQSFIMRSEDQRQAERMPKGFDIPIPKPQIDSRTQEKEEEAIELVIRESQTSAAPSPAVPTPPPTRQADSPNNGQQINVSNLPPMFVYSRNFGGARFVEPKTPTVQITSAVSEEESVERTAATVDTAQTAQAEQSVVAAAVTKTGNARRTELIYNSLPPVTVHEGEMLEAVLVNRLLVDTEPSPVITHLSRDLFDSSGRFVVFPANSRVIGYSQAINYRGASRLFISFHRIILPNGVSVELPQSQRMMRSLDETGALGIVSQVNRRWFLQFGTAILFGVIDGIAGFARRNQQVDTSHGIVISRTSENFDRVLDRIMAQYSSIVPIIRVNQGTTLRIYISDDMVISPYARISDRSYYENR